MKVFRDILLWLALAGLAALVALAILGAALPPDRAATFFTCPPMAAFWAGLLVLLAAGVLFFPVMFRRPGLALLHAGAALVIAGGLWGSQPAHDYRAAHNLGPALARGSMRIYQGQAQSRVFPAGEQSPANLPFALRLDKFWIDFHAPAPDHWPLLLRRDVTQGDRVVSRETALSWTLGREFLLPGTGLHVTVLDYAAASLYKPQPAFSLGRPSPDWNCNPDAQLPRLTLRIRRGGESQTALWSIRQEMIDSQGWDALDLQSFYGPGDNADLPWAWAGRPMLIIEKPRNDDPALGGLNNIRHFNTRLALLDSAGREIPNSRSTLQVNRPLFHEGYQFTQSNWDVGRWRFVDLAVSSTAGVPLVFAGLGALGLGAIVQFWFRPILAALRRPRS